MFVTVEKDPRYEVEIVPKSSITIRDKDGHTNTFKMGDMAEYDSYNLRYYGTIVSITNKTVTIQERHKDKRHRLSLDKFCWRNIKFVLHEVVAKNHETSHYI